MRGGKDEKKQMDPLFPRLHINDTEKGGPRAPPRNKMALCEGINIPPPRSSSTSISMRPLPSGNNSSLVPSESQSHVGCPQKSGFSSFCSLPGSSNMSDRYNSYSSNLLNFDTKLTNPEIQILKPANYQTFSTRGSSKMIAECHLFHPFSLYNSENSSVKILGKKDDVGVPYFAQLNRTLHCDDIGYKSENEKLMSSSLSCSGAHQTTSERKEKEVRSTDLNSREHIRDQTDDKHEESQTSEENAETPSLLSTDKKVLADAAANQLTRNMTSEFGTREPMYQARCNIANDRIRLEDPCTQSHQSCRTSLEKNSSTDGIYRNLERFSRKRSYSTMEAPSCSSANPEENNRTPNILESVNECPRGNDSEVGDDERNIAISDTSVADSKSHFKISPDDVVGVIGVQLFWKVRRTIAHQQRIFAVQIFELHRLIKVQRLIAESPEMLSEDALQISKPSIKCAVKRLSSQNSPEAASPMKRIVFSHKPNSSSLETAVEDAHVKQSPLKCESEKGHVTPRSTLKPYSYSGCSTSSSFVSDVKLGPWSFHPGCQWLVPIRSPSEGLVYKPYTGPCPSVADCIASVYGNCEPSLTRMDRDFMTTIYGIPTPSQQGGHFQPYAIPLVNTSNCSKNLPASKGSDLLGSSASSPTERVQGDALSLFPITPTVKTSQKPIPTNKAKQQSIQVIKVVPHNPKSACESAARIFRSIQEERQKQD